MNSGSSLNGIDIRSGSGVNKPLKGQPPIISKKAARAAARSTKPKSIGSRTSSSTDFNIDDASAHDPQELPEITGFSQQSRFHRETFDANSTDIDVKGVHVSIGQKDILVDAHLRLKKGVKYGMVGQNGVGKSILMSVLGNNLLVGLPQNVKFLHIAQLEEFEPGRTVLQEVVESDVERMRVIREVKALQLAIPTSSVNSGTLKQTVFDILLSRSATQLELARKIATKRSGQRGYIARQALLAHEASHRDLTVQNPEEYITRDIVRDVVKDVLKRFGEYFGGGDTGLVEAAGGDGIESAVAALSSLALTHHEGESKAAGGEGMLDAEKEMEQSARKVLMSFGFTEEEVGMSNSGAKELGALSGGWKMRVVLAKALFLKPDVLLLDEPTNHLDLPAIMCLTQHLISSFSSNPQSTNTVDSSLTNPDQTVVIVSHDRDFLSRVTSETIIFKDGKLTYHKGDYDDWERSVGEKKRRMGRLKELEEKRKKQIQAVIQKNVQIARTSGDDKRLGMVASRKKALDRLGMQRLEDGKRHKVSYHGERAEIVVEEGFKTAPITLPDPYQVPFHTNAILQLGEVSFAYSSKPTAKAKQVADKYVVKNVSLDVSPNARIALLGPNGCGKSTLMNLLAGVLKPTNGEVRKHHRLRVGYFSQHTVSQLDLELSPLEALRAMYSPSPSSTTPSAIGTPMSATPSPLPQITIDDLAGPLVITEQQARAHFAMVGIQGGSLVHQKIRTLSGGQRNRVALGLVTFHEPHVLLLDEITNHLDVGSVESVVEALNAFGGAVVVVSHDVWFLKQVVGGGEDEDDEDEDEDGAGEGAGESKGVFYVVNPKSAPGGLVRWEKGLDAYVERERRRAEKLVGGGDGLRRDFG